MLLKMVNKIYEQNACNDTKNIEERCPVNECLIVGSRTPNHNNSWPPPMIQSKYSPYNVHSTSILHFIVFAQTIWILYTPGFRKSALWQLHRKKNKNETSCDVWHHSHTRWSASQMMQKTKPRVDTFWPKDTATTK